MIDAEWGISAAQIEKLAKGYQTDFAGAVMTN